MLISFASSALAELFALSFYYPFDLIKTRMQTSNERFKYRGVLDAVLKIYNEDVRAEGRWKKQMLKIRLFYKGMLLYGTAYILLMAIEFALFEGTLQYLETIDINGKN